MTPSTALVTLAVGPGFAERWHRLCEPLWKRYADRHGYDVICLEEPLDTSPRASRRSPAWQKCLVLGQEFSARYERIVWVDADVLINPAAPAVAAGVAPERVAAVNEYATPTRELYAQTLRKLYRLWEREGVPFIRNESPRDYYGLYGLPGGFDDVVQTGVLVLSPRHHGELLERTYERYEDRGAAWNYEMRPLSYELLDAGVVQWLDPRFNYVWGLYKALHFPFLFSDPGHPRLTACASEALAETYFLHFAGSVGEMPPDALEPAAPPAPRPKGARSARRRLRTPVVLFVHARPELTRRLAEAVRAVRPELVLVVADGPTPELEERCAATRAEIEQAGWNCDVVTNYADENLGLKRRVETGLDWAFGRVDEAIVLEDDCLPHPSFFRFCAELLERYRDDPRVLAISGNNFEPDAGPAGASYRFSRYPLIWGWATWRRAWSLYDADLSRWPELRDGGWLDDLLGDAQAAQYWSYLFERTHASALSWDYAFVLAAWLAGGLSVVPHRNLVSNVGFGAGATNTRAEHRGIFADVPAVAMEFPLRHPPRVERDGAADEFLESVMFSGNVRRMFERLRARRADRRHAVHP